MVNFVGEKSVRSRSEWKLLSVNKTRLFLAISILEGIVKKPEESRTKKTWVETQFFRDIMTFNKYSEIKKYLYFLNNEARNVQNHPHPNCIKFRLFVSIWIICIEVQLPWKRCHYRRKFDVQKTFIMVEVHIPENSKILDKILHAVQI